jgi:hypothetical protein
MSIRDRRALRLRICVFLGGLLVALSGVTTPVQAQGTGAVEGSVVEPFEEPIRGATVSVLGGTQSATTDENGEYRIEGLSSGQRTLRVSADTFQTTEKTVDIFADSTVTEFFFLDPGLIVESPSQATRGTNVSIQVATPDGFQPAETSLSVRRAGASGYRLVSLNQTGPTTFEGTIPDTAVTVRGVEFFAEVTYDEEETATAPEVNPFGQPFFIPVRASQLETPLPLWPEQYTMVSIPLTLDDPSAEAVFGDDYGPPNRSAWRLLRWNGEAERYEEVSGAAEREADLEPGSAFWLVSRDGTAFDVENARSVSQEPVSVSLTPGWNQVANPRAYPVAWGDVEGHTIVEDPVAFDPQAAAEGGYWFGVSVLFPWTGYWVFNPEPEPVELLFPQNEAEGEVASRANSSTLNKTVPEALFGTELDYAVRFEATLDRSGGSTPETFHDAKNVVGIKENMRRSQQGVAEPPPIGEHVRLSILEDGNRLAGSLRPAGKEGQTWDLNVTAEGAELSSDPHTIHVELHEYGARPSDFNRQLIDRDTGRRIPLDDGAFSVPVTDERPTRRLRFLLGTETFVHSEKDRIRPQRTTLEPPYPNPTRGAVSIDYQLRTDQHVRISVFDVLGRRIRTLVNERQPAGPHTVRWAMDAGGDMASGLYFVRMEAGPTRTSRQILLVQ